MKWEYDVTITNDPGVGVSKALFVNFSGTENFALAKV